MRRAAWPVVIGSLLGVIGCSVSTEPPPSAVVVEEPNVPIATAGTLRVLWTVDGRADPSACIQSVAADIEIAIFTPGGREVGAYRQNCQTFATSITLEPGAYNASAILLDPAGQPRTTEVFIDPFNLRANATLEVPIDFPADSFL